MPNLDEDAIIAEIVKGIEAGKKPAQIMSAIVRKWPQRKFGDRTYRRYRIKADAIVLERKRIRDEQDAATEAILRSAEVASDYCDVDERKKFLAKVIRGEDLRPVDMAPDLLDVIHSAITTTEETKGKGRAPKPKKPRPIIAGIDTRIDAVEVLNKMDGIYIKRIKNEDPPAPLIIGVGPKPKELEKKNPGK